MPFIFATQGFLLFSFIFAPCLSSALTNPDDVAAINGLYLALGSPVLPGWVASGGDPCGGAWQGILCNGSQVQTITLNGANLGGELGDGLSLFTSIEKIDLSNNRIGGSIPSALPLTLQNLFLSDNKFTGSIPESLSTLKLLTDMSLNNNHLLDEIPDVFQDLGGLINLDLSSNNLSGTLPPSMQNLSTLTTLRLQDNHLSGKLDVLQHLPLQDLNVENNLFNGPIPEQLLDIPKFKKDGNAFNVTIAPSPAPGPPSPVRPFFGPPSTNTSSGHGQTQPRRPHARPPPDRSSSPEVATSNEKPKSFTSKRIVWISIAAVVSIIVLGLACLLCWPKCIQTRKHSDRIFKEHPVGAYGTTREREPTEKLEKVPVVRPKEVKPKVVESEAERTTESATSVESHEIDMSGFDTDVMPPPPPPPRPFKRVIETAKVPVTETYSPTTSVRHFSIASLQQYTNSFSQENLIGSGMLGSVYRAELQGGKLLAVKKLDKKASNHQGDEEFIKLVKNIDKIRHANVVQLVGYCAEHDQRLLIYEYCSNGTLQELIHSDDGMRIKLSWSSRVRMALEAAKALEYLHEICDPPVIHRNFKSANILLDDHLNVYVSECGLAPLISSGSVSQLSGQLLAAYGYGAPEFEYGIYTSKCDVYSFGVVMLELLTGRKSYDKNRNRGEQFLVRWAIPQLHDIDALSRMVDPSLNRDYPAKSLSHFADIISRCVQSEPEFRPPMSEVVQDLSDMIRREHQRNGSKGVP